ncbi:hypothetical protein CDAR_63211 [Caerostris darwini]|uniref:Uncharacterized protein n=1 Tax=Caerostris darwini TaxID=1538125 RepID=A0AAV4W5I2_9ARAC|nr:hypothetical protein CDAR_63211 [Caerostris darwini]
MPSLDVPYVILSQISFSSYEISSLNGPQVPIGVYRASVLKYFLKIYLISSIRSLRKYGRPPTKSGQTVSPATSAGSPPMRCRRNQRGRM